MNETADRQQSRGIESAQTGRRRPVSFESGNNPPFKLIMLFIVQFEDIYADQPERLADRAAHMDAHLAFLSALGDRVVASGALREAEDGVPQGGLWIVNAMNKDEVEAWVQKDPFWKAGLRKSVRISVWAKAVWSPAFTDCIDNINRS